MKAARHKALLKAYAREWTPFTEVTITDQMRQEFTILKHCHSIYANSRFEVQIFQLDTQIGGVNQVNISRHGQIEDVTWTEAQRVIHELFGPEVSAVELYPSIEHEWNTDTRVKVLWVLPSTYQLPFGIHVSGAFGRNG